jgi:nanoRNase/pAp phosphatase (c-di-AMP/oligoRNAs hydrolase)
MLTEVNVTLSVLHDYPAPDAISCAFAHRVIGADYDTGVDIAYDGRISHRQNVALVKLMGLDLVRCDGSVDLRQYDGAAYVDSQGANARAIAQALKDAQVPTLIVVDHHEAQEGLSPEFADIRPAGAAATIYAGYLKERPVQMDKARREHVMVTTSLMHGIVTDTNGLVRAGS